MNPMLGVQNNELVEYTNLMKNIVSQDYLQSVHPFTGDVNKNEVDGTRSVGSIDFQPYEIDPQYQNTGGYTISVSNPEMGVITISNPFDLVTTIDEETGDTLYLWHNVLRAINNFQSSPCNYTAALDPYSHPDPASSIKRVVITADSAGSECNGFLSWDIPDEYLYTENPGNMFNPLIGGKSYPIVHLYEDFGEIYVDPFSVLYFDVISSNPNVVSASYHSPNDILNSGDIDLYVNNVGDSSTIGGYDIPNLVTDANIEDFPGAGESSGSQVIKITSQNLGGSGNIIKDGDDGPELLQGNFTGDIDLAIRALDDNAMTDLYTVRLRIHPINDPPVIEVSDSRTIYANNENYPTDVDLKVVTSDVEEGNRVLERGDVYIVDNNHCDEIETIVDELSNWYVPVEYRANLIPYPYEFRFRWRWEIYDNNEYNPGDVIIEYYYEDDYNSATNYHELTCVDETQTGIPSDYAECNTVEVHTIHSSGSPRFYTP